MKYAPFVMKHADSYVVRIWIAGDYDKARDATRQFCLEFPSCFTLQRTDYIYTGGEEAGVCVTLINYPRFPREPQDLLNLSRMLAQKLAEELAQGSYSIETPEETTWYSRRGDSA